MGFGCGRELVDARTRYQSTPNTFPEEAVRKESIDRWQAPPEPNKKRLGVFLLVWFCLTLLLAYVWVSPEVLCDTGFQFEPRSGLCRYVYVDNWGMLEWSVDVFLLLMLFILPSLFLIPFVTMYWICLIVESWISKKSDV